MMKNVLKYRDLLSAQSRKTAVYLVGLMFIGMLLETISVGMIGPTIGVMSQDNLAAKYPRLLPFLHFIGDPDQTHLVIDMMLALVAIYVVKAVFLTFLSWKQFKFVYDSQAALSYRLFSGYMRQPWTFHLQRNSAEMIRNTTTEIQIFTAQGMTPLTVAVTESLVLAGIVLLLFVAEPVGSLIVVITLSVAATALQYLARGHLLRWGQTRWYHERHRIQQLQEGIGGVKEIKLLGRESEFFQRYHTHAKAVAAALQKLTTIQQLPRTWLEMMLVVALAVLILTMVALGQTLAGVVPVLALFVAATFRLIPSVSRMVISLQAMRNGEPVLDHLREEILLLEKTPSSPPGEKLDFGDALELSHISLVYPGADRPALEDINLVIQRGLSVGFIGSSGAGKSTLVDVVLGLLSPNDGQVKVDGFDIQQNLRGWQDQIGYVPQTIFLTDDSLRRNIALGVAENEIDDTAVAHAVKAAQLDDFIRELPQGIETLVGERGVRLSGGQRQRIGIARALYHDPAILVLDEATSALDSETEQGVVAAVTALQGEKTMLIIAHRLSTIAHCDRIYRLENGRIVGEGSYQEVAAVQMQTAEEVV